MDICEICRSYIKEKKVNHLQCGMCNVFLGHFVINPEKSFNGTLQKNVMPSAEESPSS